MLKPKQMVAASLTVVRDSPETQDENIEIIQASRAFGPGPIPLMSFPVLARMASTVASMRSPSDAARHAAHWLVGVSLLAGAG